MRFWSALTCQRFGPWRLDATFFVQLAFIHPGRDKSRPAKALTGQRTPN